MRVEDLRIGNWVYQKPNNNIVKVHYLDIAEQTYINILHPSNFEPIPLTEQWLKDFGFEPDNKEYLKSQVWSKNVLGVLIGEPITTVLIYGYARYIEQVYIHQLQNLYHSLTGEELKKGEAR